MTSTMRFDKWENSLGQPYSTVLQVVQAVKTDVFTASVDAGSRTTAVMSASITPTSATSKILVSASINGSATTNGVANIQLLRNSTPISIGDAVGSRPPSSTSIDSNGAGESVPASISFLDSPATTSPTIYKLAVNTGDTGGTAYINRISGDADNIYNGRYASSITLMEIAQ